MNDEPFYHLNSYEKLQSFNSFGQRPHETDKVIHWTDRQAVNTSRQLREAYDLICYAGLQKELDILVKAAVLKTELEIAELEAGEGI